MLFYSHTFFLYILELIYFYKTFKGAKFFPKT